MRAVPSLAGEPGAVPRFLLKHLRWILLVTLVVTAGAALYSWSQTPTYRAEVDVLVDPRVVTDTAPPQPPNMETEKAVASSGVVLGAAASALHVRADELEEGLSIKVPVDTHVLQITYSHRNPAEARRRVQGLAEAYVAFHAQQEPPSQPDKVKTTTSLAGIVQGVIITPAGIPNSPATPNHPVDVGVALIMGLGLGIGTAAVRDRLDDRLRGPGDIEAQASVPVLSGIPAFRVAGVDTAARLVMVNSPNSAVAEAYRNLRASLLQCAARRNAKVVLVTTPAGKATSTVAANLATAVAQSGRRVVVVCADLRRPQTHQFFGMENHVGLQAVVDGHLSLAQALLTTGVGELLLLPAGRPVEDPGAVLQAPGMRKAIDELRGLTDLVIVDAPPVSAGADAMVLAELADVVLLVCDSRRSTRAQVRRAVRELGRAGEKLVGCVLDNVGRRRRLPTAPSQQHTGSPYDDGRYVGRVPSEKFSKQQATPN
jgi:succinoglycan biosynthesis transport protein ExoP